MTGSLTLYCILLAERSDGQQPGTDSGGTGREGTGSGGMQTQHCLRCAETQRYMYY